MLHQSPAPYRVLLPVPQASLWLISGPGIALVDERHVIQDRGQESFACSRAVSASWPKGSRGSPRSGARRETRPRTARHLRLRRAFGRWLGLCLGFMLGAALSPRVGRLSLRVSAAAPPLTPSAGRVTLVCAAVPRHRAPVSRRRRCESGRVQRPDRSRSYWPTPRPAPAHRGSEPTSASALAAAQPRPSSHPQAERLADTPSPQRTRLRRLARGTRAPLGSYSAPGGRGPAASEGFSATGALALGHHPQDSDPKL